MPATLESAGPTLLHSISWEGYLRICDELSDNTRTAYHNGWMEIMSPVSTGHEVDASVLARLLELFCTVRRIPLNNLGSATLRRGDMQVGIEPDECWYVHATPPPRDARELIDLSIYDAPDLALEVEVSRSSLPKEPIYAAIGTAELWRLSRGQLTIRLLRPDRSGYDTSPTSKLLPTLPIDELVRHLNLDPSHTTADIAQRWFDFLLKGG